MWMSQEDTAVIMNGRLEGCIRFVVFSAALGSAKVPQSGFIHNADWAGQCYEVFAFPCMLAEQAPASRATHICCKAALWTLDPAGTACCEATTNPKDAGGVYCDNAFADCTAGSWPPCIASTLHCGPWVQRVDCWKSRMFVWDRLGWLFLVGDSSASFLLHACGKSEDLPLVLPWILLTWCASRWLWTPRRSDAAGRGVWEGHLFQTYSAWWKLAFFYRIGSDSGKDF